MSSQCCAAHSFSQLPPALPILLLLTDCLVVPHLGQSHTAAFPGPFAVPPHSLVLHPALLFTSSRWEQPVDPSIYDNKWSRQAFPASEDFGWLQAEIRCTGVFEREKWTTSHQRSSVGASGISPSPALLRATLPRHTNRSVWFPPTAKLFIP